MENMDTTYKAILGVVGTFISFLVDGVGLAFTILLGMMLFDFITGLLVGWKTRNIKSAIARDGFIKKLYIILLIGAIYMLSHVVEGIEHIGDGVTIAYIVVEFISITENGGKLGAPLGPVKNVIAVLKGDNNANKGK